MSPQGAPGRYLRLLPALAPQAHEGPVARDPGDPRPDRSGIAARRLVGRERELSELIAGLDEAGAGRGSLFLLCGEPGIGKTRLAKELAELAARRNARVLWGRAWEGGGQPAYWPWVQILRSYVRGEDPRVVAAEVGGGAVHV